MRAAELSALFHPSAALRHRYDAPTNTCTYLVGTVANGYESYVEVMIGQPDPGLGHPVPSASYGGTVVRLPGLSKGAWMLFSANQTELRTPSATRAG